MRAGERGQRSVSNRGQKTENRGRKRGTDEDRGNKREDD